MAQTWHDSSTRRELSNEHIVQKIWIRIAQNRPFPLMLIGSNTQKIGVNIG
jgi:hypothetical protein